VPQRQPGNIFAASGAAAGIASSSGKLFRGQRSVAGGRGHFSGVLPPREGIRALRCLTNFPVYGKFELCFQHIKQAI
jgi:hypothetical protein